MNWLMKSEPEAFSIDDLMNCPNQTDFWDGIRNYQARNMMRDQMQIGDRIFFYHSNCTPPGIVGTMKVASEAYADFTQFDPDSKYYDPKSTQDNPRWVAVDVTFVEKFSGILSLDALKQYPELADMPLLRKGNRLSITPVTDAQWDFIVALTR